MKFGWVAALPLGVGVCLLACGDDDNAQGTTLPDGGILDGSVQNDGAPGSNGPQTISFTTTAPAGSQSAGGPANAKLALRLNDDGTTWSALTATVPGVYSMTTTLARWVAAFICADDNGNATVAIYERAAAVTTLDVTLGQACALTDKKVWDLTGTFSNLPATTSWFDFAYVADSRGSVLPLSGTSADYELPHLVEGTWDLAFGFRDDSNSALTKLFFKRAQAIAADFTLNADISATGVTPVMHPVTATGIESGESLQLPITYSVGGIYGIGVGPQNFTSGTGQYATVPAASQAAGDRYSFALSADIQTDNGASERGVTGSFHGAVDLALALPPALPPPTVTTVSTTPYLRLAVKTVGRTGTATYELDGDTRVTDQVHHTWTYSTDAAIGDGGEVDITLPDFSSVSGFSASWALTTSDTAVGVKAIEASAALSDGTATRYASASVQLPSN